MSEFLVKLNGEFLGFGNLKRVMDMLKEALSRQTDIEAINEILFINFGYLYLIHHIYPKRYEGKAPLEINIDTKKKCINLSKKIEELIPVIKNFGWEVNEG